MSTDASAIPAFAEPMTRPTPFDPNEVVWTEEARAARAAGLVIVRCVIRKEGVIRDCHVVKGGVPLMDEAVIRALERHRTIPVTRDGQPIDVRYAYTVKLQWAAPPTPLLIPPKP